MRVRDAEEAYGCEIAAGERTGDIIIGPVRIVRYAGGGSSIALFINLDRSPISVPVILASSPDEGLACNAIYLEISRPKVTNSGWRGDLSPAKAGTRCIEELVMDRIARTPSEPELPTYRGSQLPVIYRRRDKN